MKPLKSCANGCAKPPKPPSLVICEDCIAKITRTLEEMVRAQDPQPLRPTTRTKP